MPAPPPSPPPRDGDAWCCDLKRQRSGLQTILPWLIAMAVASAIAVVQGATTSGGIEPSSPAFIASGVVLALGLVITIARSMVQPSPTHRVEIFDGHVRVVDAVTGAPELEGRVVASASGSEPGCVSVAPGLVTYSGRLTVRMPVVLLNASAGASVSIGVLDYDLAWRGSARSCWKARFVAASADWRALVERLGMADRLERASA